MKVLEQNQECEGIVSETPPSRETSHMSIRPPPSVRASKTDPNITIEASDVPSDFVARTTYMDLLLKVTGIKEYIYLFSSKILDDMDAR